MKNLLTLLMLGLVGCASFPAEGQVNPGLKFSYWHEESGGFIAAEGTAAARFSIGDKLKLRFKKQGWKSCYLTMTDGDTFKKIKCKWPLFDKEYVTVDLGVVSNLSLPVIGIRKIRKDESTESGFLYLGLGKKRDHVPLAYKCPLVSRRNNQYTCVRPVNFGFMLEVIVARDFPGKLQVSSSTCDGRTIKEIYEVTGKGRILIDMLSSTMVEYCAIRFDMKQSPGGLPEAISFEVLDGDDIFKSSSNLHLNFFRF